MCSAVLCPFELVLFSAICKVLNRSGTPLSAFCVARESCCVVFVGTPSLSLSLSLSVAVCLQ